MKIFAFTDIHADAKEISKLKAKSTDADLLICCGDFTVFGNGLSKIISEFDKIGKKMLIIHGNHEEHDEVKLECKSTKNLIFMHKKFHIHENVLFTGYGGGGFNQRDSNFENFTKEIEEKMQEKKGVLPILILHMPPFKTNQDKLPMGHVGSKSYTDFIIKYQPLLVFCGHIEENNGKVDRIGNTTIINPGPDGRIIELSHPENKK